LIVPHEQTKIEVNEKGIVTPFAAFQKITV
jgi:hypothetical protein